MTDSTSILLRLAADADTEALTSLKWAMNLAEHASLPAHSIIAGMLDLSREAAARAVAARREALIDDGGAWWVAEEHGAVLGSAFWTPWILPPAFREECARVGMIGGVVVAEHARGRGIAKRLLALMESEIAAAGLQHAFLEVVSSNEPATRLYTSLGFQDFETAMLKPVG